MPVTSPNTINSLNFSIFGSKLITFFAYFEKKIALKLLKENEILYNFFLEVVFGYIQNSFFKSIFFRVANKLSNFFKIKFLSNFFQNKIYEKYYNISDLNNNIKKRFSNFDLKKLKILMQDFTDNSPWVKKFSGNSPTSAD